METENVQNIRLSVFDGRHRNWNNSTCFLVTAFYGVPEVLKNTSGLLAISILSYIYTRAINIKRLADVRVYVVDTGVNSNSDTFLVLSFPIPI